MNTWLTLINAGVHDGVPFLGRHVCVREVGFDWAFTTTWDGRQYSMNTWIIWDINLTHKDIQILQKEYDQENIEISQH